MQKIDIRKLKDDIRQRSKEYIKQLSSDEKLKLDNAIYEKQIGALNDQVYHIDEIIGVLQEKSTEGLQGYENAMHSWIEEKGDIDSEEKRNILERLYASSKVALIYGAAGTGKTYLINLLSQFMDSQTKLRI